MGAQPRREDTVQPRALRFRQAAVRNIADQHVTEAICLFARDGRKRLAGEQLPVDEIGERGVDVELWIELADRPPPEHAADDRAMPQHRLRPRWQAVDPRRDQRLQRVGNPHARGIALVHEEPHRLLDEERVPLGLVEQRGPEVVREREVFDERVDQHSRLVVG